MEANQQEQQADHHHQCHHEEGDDFSCSLDSTSLQASARSGSTSSSGGVTNHSDTIVGLSADEDKAVTRSKWCFLFVLVAAAATLGTVVYLVVRNEEKDDFESKVRTTA